MKKIFSFSKSQNIKILFCTQKFFSSAVYISCLLLTAPALLRDQLAFSQPPQGINYQAVARDAAGNPLASQTVAVTFRIRQTSSTGTVVYRGAETYTTNQFGLFTAIIGQTASDSGIFSSISWGSDVFYLQVLVNGNNMGATQFMSVPYALFADSAGKAPVPASWSLLGNTASFGQYFGTNNSLDLIFKTNNLERMRIDSTTGFVGINANPSYLLHIGGGTGNTSIALDEYNVRRWVISAGFPVSNKFSIRNVTIGANAITIDSANQVGIGTATPGAKLEIVGSSGATIKIADGNQGANKVLTSDAIGQGSWQTPATSAPGFSNMQVFSTAGTFTFTTGANVTQVMVEVWGGGGGGSAIVNSEGGSAGGYGKEIFSVTPSTNYNVTVGAGGIGVLNSTGTNGGTSSFGLLISATGGGGAGGLGGTSSAAFNITGGSGAGEAGLSVPGVARTCFGGTAGGGGGAGGMYSSTAADPKRNGIAPGGGGAGGCGFNTGASGASGRVVVWW